MKTTSESNTFSTNYTKGVMKLAHPSLYARIGWFFGIFTMTKRIFQISGLNAEEIIRIDANLELAARNAVLRQEPLANEYLRKLISSNLVCQKKVLISGCPRFYPWRLDSIKGFINGQFVKIKNLYYLGSNEIFTGGDGKTRYKGSEESWTGTLNGNKLPQDEARKIFTEYFPLAKERMEALQNLVFLKKKDREINKLFFSQLGNDLQAINS